MEATAESFNAHRPRLFGLAYRMLGSRAEAEDVLQDAYLRWHAADRGELRTPEAWLVTVVTRLCIDRLRAAKLEREAYVGPWLPEPLASDELPSPEQQAELASDVSIAFLMVLERLAPDERAAFLLREVFDLDYPEISQMLGKGEAAVRQTVHRAKARVVQERPRFTVSADAHKRLLEKFVAASRSGDHAALTALFAAESSVTADGGGKVVSALKVLHGVERIVRFYEAIARRFEARLDYQFADVNGTPGLLRYIDGAFDAAFSFVTDGVHILDVYIVRNPDKLKGFISH